MADEGDEALCAGVAVRTLPGRGRGLVATKDFMAGERLFVAAAFGYSLHAEEKPREDELAECCTICLRFSERLPVRCSGCPAAYCSESCQEIDVAAGHRLCCGGLSRISAMNSRKASTACKGAACFLLRAFAARRAHAAAAERERPAAHDHTLDKIADGEQQQREDEPSSADPFVEYSMSSRSLGPPSFELALGQCSDYREADSADGSFYDAREAFRGRAIDLAVKQAGKLISPRAECVSPPPSRHHPDYACVSL